MFKLPPNAKVGKTAQKGMRKNYRNQPAFPEINPMNVNIPRIP